MLRFNFDDYISKPDRDQQIWRYSDFTKFVSVLDAKALFFPQVKVMPDKYEGFVSATDGSELQRELRGQRSQMTSPWSYTVISCWCMNDYESDTLWGRYAIGTERIAICTTVGKLENSINRSPLSQVFTGIVQYRDPPEPDSKPGEGYPHQVSMFYKRPMFSDEKEFRIIADVKDLRMAEELHGVYVPTNLELLFERIYVSPNASQWFLGLVISLVKKVAPSARILRSEIGHDPYGR